jgi:hypothetical protein
MCSVLPNGDGLGLSMFVWVSAWRTGEIHGRLQWNIIVSSLCEEILDFWQNSDRHFFTYYTDYFGAVLAKSCVCLLESVNALQASTTSCVWGFNGMLTEGTFWTVNASIFIICLGTS